MVAKLTGVVEGAMVIFERKSGDTWICTVPATLSGTYVLELTAIDEAGNMAYCARYIIAIDLASLCVHLEPYPWSAELLGEEFYATLMNNRCGGI